jgi:protein gp37
MSNTKIEWTESTWNPVTGCTKISSGCKNCYAERMAKRLKAMGQANYSHGFELTIHPHVLEHPLKWQKPQVIFVNSMSDLFHEDIPFEFIKQIFDVMTQASWHTFQILTKRSKRLEEVSPYLDWPDNVWMGVTVESQAYIDRIESLRKVPAAVRFLSLEPLLSDVHHIDLEEIHWVIVGGESGPGSRPIQKEWVRNIQRQCEDANVPFFFKQWGGVNKKKSGRELDGKTYSEMPELQAALAS